MATNVFGINENLPGLINQIIENYKSGYDETQFGTTNSVTVVGTAFNGPVGTVVPIFSPEHAKYIFGDSYDTKTRREATLVPEIYDMFAKGCKTIYAVRVSGKEICKDYQFATDTNLKLRLSGYFPSNENKECFMVYDSTQGPTVPGKIKVFKPATRTNMNEKQQGVVDNINSILVVEMSLENYGFTKDTRLYQFIDTFNSLSTNNVLKLSIVDEEGIAITSSSPEVQELSLGVLFPGIYTIGRDKAADKVLTTTEVEFQINSKNPLYNSYDKTIWKKLIINTDVSKPYPIYAENIADLSKKIIETGLIPDADYKYLKVPEAIDKLATKDNIDYEEVELGAFDLYKRLGSGYAKTAMVKKLTGGTEDNPTYHYKVVQTPDENTNKVVGINDGIYSMLQNRSSNYITLTCATAETKMESKLPKKEEFKKAVGNIITLKDNTTDVLNVTCKVNEKDFSENVFYNISIEEDKTIIKEDILNNIITDKFIRVPVIGKSEIAKAYNVVDGQLALGFDDTTPVTAANKLTISGTLYKYNKKLKVFEEAKLGYIPESTKLIIELKVDSASELLCFEFSNDKTYKACKTLEADKYFVALSDEHANIYKIETPAEAKVTPLLSLSSIADSEDDEEYTLVFLEGELPKLPCKISDNTIQVLVKSNKLEWSSYNDMIEELNLDKVLSKKFEFTLKNSSLVNDDFPTTGLVGSGENKLDFTYDENKYIPYTTNDNFVRQLAQFCTYTSMKTYAIHGVIGFGKLNGLTTNTIANKVNDLLNVDFDLYGKNTKGNNILDEKNLPIDIGRYVSVTFMQYPVTTGNGYNYLSNGCGGYAGFTSTLNAQRSSTNQKINISGLMFELSNYQLNLLTQKGIVTCKTTTDGIVITDGVTQAPINTPYRRLSTMKIINTVDVILRETLSPFIGLVDNLATKNSMQTAIKSALNPLKDVLFSNYDFNIVSNPSDSAKGIININYTLLPVNEIVQIYNNLTVTASDN